MVFFPTLHALEFTPVCVWTPFFLLAIPLFNYQIYTSIRKYINQSDRCGLSPLSPWLINPLTWYFSDTERLGHLGIFISALMMCSSCWQLACVKRTSISASAQLWVFWHRLCSAPNLQENCRCHLNINKPSERSVGIISFVFTFFITHVFQCPFPMVPQSCMQKVQSALQSSSHYVLLVVLFHLFHPLWHASSSYLYSRIFLVSRIQGTQLSYKWVLLGEFLTLQ